MCPICYLEFQEPKGIIVECRHSFCFECIKDWLDVQFNCPLCKVEILHIEKLKDGQTLEIIEAQKL